MSSFFEKNISIFLKNQKLKTPLLMGILNITPDSFFDGGYYTSIDNAIKQVEKLVIDGADIIDIGGESTRPYSDSVSEKEEINRVIPVLKEIKKRFPKIKISIDTTKSAVMKEALIEGVDIINDISALVFDLNAAKELAKYNCPIVIMHSPWRPKTMQSEFNYTKPVIEHIQDYFTERIESLESIGIKKERLILDPGVGFGKSVENNFDIIVGFSKLKSFGRPILIGASNKSYIAKTINDDSFPRVEGNVLTEVISLLNEVDILRVHDIASTKKTLKLFNSFIDAIKRDITSIE
ncbi:dihydropteroate synthase [bacterium]|nr:dihydropteroate synthase [bacterium]